MAENTAKEFGLPVPMFLSLIDHESGWNMSAKSQAGALGLGQVMPANLKRLGVDEAQYMKDPALQLNQAAFFYRDAIRQAKGDPILGLAFYNASPKAVNRFLEGKSGLPTETANYVPTVLWGSQKFGGAPLPSQAMQDVKTRFGSRISDKTLIAKTGQQPNPSTAYVDPKKDPGLDASPMASADIPQQVQATQQPQQVAQQVPQQQNYQGVNPDLVQQQTQAGPDLQQMAADNAQQLAQISNQQAASTQVNLQNTLPQEFNLQTALGLEPETQPHGYPDWFAKMVQTEVAAA